MLFNKINYGHLKLKYSLIYLLLENLLSKLGEIVLSNSEIKAID